MTIRNATSQDAPLIATAILEAIGPEITVGLAGDKHTPEEVHALFAHLAEKGNTQYSYLNTRVAVDDDGEPMGICVSYDGADLKNLRRPFFKEAATRLGWEMTEEEVDELPGETEPDEFYLDTLMTLPEHRGKGVAKFLISDASEKARKVGKPLGLLCDTHNPRARRLYDSIGFRTVGCRPFAGHLMDHLQL